MEELKGNVKTFYAPSQEAWRKWLADNHDKEQSVWLIIYKKESKIPTVYYPEAVDEAICFGWIDSLINKRDEESYFQFFAKRNPASNWSKVNKDKVARLIAANAMQAAGLKMVELAKQTGTWDALNDIEKAVLPPDLQAAFKQNEIAFKNWEQFPHSTKRGILEWLLNAKKEETRQKRILEIVSLAAQNIRANQYNPQKK